MNPSRSLVFSILIIVASCCSINGQRRFERLPAPRDPQFYEPRNKLEDLLEHSPALAASRQMR